VFTDDQPWHVLLFSIYRRLEPRWNVSNVKDLSFKFNSVCSFYQDMSQWNVKKGTSLKGLFDGTQINRFKT
jgi:hypothetical protein